MPPPNIAWLGVRAYGLVSLVDPLAVEAIEIVAESPGLRGPIPPPVFARVLGDRAVAAATSGVLVRLQAIVGKAAAVVGTDACHPAAAVSVLLIGVGVAAVQLPSGTLTISKANALLGHVDVGMVLGGTLVLNAMSSLSAFPTPGVCFRAGLFIWSRRPSLVRFDWLLHGCLCLWLWPS